MNACTTDIYSKKLIVKYFGLWIRYLGYISEYYVYDFSKLDTADKFYLKHLIRKIFSSISLYKFSRAQQLYKEILAYNYFSIISVSTFFDNMKRKIVSRKRSTSFMKSNNYILKKHFKKLLVAKKTKSIYYLNCLKYNFQKLNFGLKELNRQREICKSIEFTCLKFKLRRAKDFFGML